MAYRVTTTVTVHIEKAGAGSTPPGLNGKSERPGAVIEQSVTRTTGGPSERYCYPEAADAITEAKLTVLNMMEAAYGKADRQS